MLDPATKGSIQDIAIKVTEEQIINRNIDSKEKTIFVLGSKGVVSEIEFSNRIFHDEIKFCFQLILPGKDHAHKQFFGP